MIHSVWQLDTASIHNGIQAPKIFCWWKLEDEWFQAIQRNFG